MSTRNSVCVLVGALALSGSPASGQHTFQHSVGTNNGTEVGYDIDHIPGGGFCVAGYEQFVGQPADVYVNRFREDGLLIWARRLFGTSREVGYAIRPTSDGGFLVGAETDSGAPANTQIALAKINGLGNLTWAFRYGGTGFVDAPSGVSVRTLDDGGAVLVGRRANVGNFPLAGVMIRVDANGAPLFQRLYEAFDPFADTGTLSLTDVRARADGFIACGWIDDRQFGGRIIPLLLRTDLAGNVVWSRTYGQPAADVTADGLDVAANGDIVFSGRMSVSTTVPTTLFLARTDAAGNPIWYSGLPSVVNGFAAVQVTSAQDIVVAGTTTTGANDPLGQDACIAKFDSSGALIWAQRYGDTGHDEGHGVVSLDCGRGYALAGLSRVGGRPGLEDVYLVRATAYGQSGCLEQSFGLPLPIVVTPSPLRTLHQLAQTEFTTWAIQSTVQASINVTHCAALTCPADVDDGSGTGTPDGGVDINDLLYFLAQYEAGGSCADLDDGSGTGTPDGGVDINDLLYFLTRYEGGC